MNAPIAKTFELHVLRDRKVCLTDITGTLTTGPRHPVELTWSWITQGQENDFVGYAHSVPFKLVEKCNNQPDCLMPAVVAGKCQEHAEQLQAWLDDNAMQHDSEGRWPA